MFPREATAVNAVAFEPTQYVYDAVVVVGAATLKNFAFVKFAPVAATELLARRASGVTPSGANKFTQLI